MQINRPTIRRFVIMINVIDEMKLDISHIYRMTSQMYMYLCSCNHPAVSSCNHRGSIKHTQTSVFQRGINGK